MTKASVSDALRERLVRAAADTNEPTAIRLAALLWNDCPVDALERAARSGATIERLASARHPQTPAASLPRLVREGPESDRLFWLGVVVHVTSDFENGGERGWKELFDVATVIAELARAGALVDTPTHAIARDLHDASAPETTPARLAELSQHPLPVVTALLLARGDLTGAAEVGMLLGEPHPLIAEKLALRTRSALVLAALAEKLLAKVDRRESSEWRRVEKEIAASPHVPPDVLEAVVSRDGFGAWWQLAENPALAPSLQVKLVGRCAGDQYTLVALAGNAAATTETLGVLAVSSFARVRAVVARHPRAPEMLVARLAADSAATVRAAIARRPDLSDALARELADAGDAVVTRALAENPRVPEDRRLAYEALAESDTAIRDALAKSPKTAPALLARWLGDTDVSQDPAKRRALFGLCVALAANPATPPERLSACAGRTAIDYLEASPAARNPSCPIEALERIADADPSSSMRLCLFENPACPTPILERALVGLLTDLREDGIFRSARNVLWARSARGAAR